MFVKSAIEEVGGKAVWKYMSPQQRRDRIAAKALTIVYMQNTDLIEVEAVSRLIREMEEESGVAR